MLLLSMMTSPEVPARREGRRATAEAGSASRVADSPWIRGFRPVCEAAAVAWDVPGARRRRRPSAARLETFAVGCDPTTRFRIASITKPFTATLALELLDLEAHDRASGPPTSGSATCSRTRAATTASCRRPEPGSATATTRWRRAVAELPAVRRLAGRRAGVVVREHRLLARRPRSRARAGRHDATRTRSRRHDPRARRPRVDLVRRARARGHRARGALDGPYPRARRPSGGLVSNVADLLRFGQWHLRAAATRPGCGSSHGKPTAGVYGLGLFGRARRRRRGLGPRRLVRRLPVLAPASCPTADAVFAGLTNSEPRQPRRCTTLEDAFFERRARRAAARRRARRPAARRRSTASPAPTRTATTLDGGRARARRPRRSRSTTTSYPARAIGERTFEITRATRSATASTSRSRASAASAAGSPSASRDRPAVAAGHPATADGRAPRSSPTAAPPPTRPWPRRSPLRRRDADDRAARRRPRDLLRRGERHRAQSRLLRLGAVRSRRADGARCPCGSARRSSTTRSARRRVRCPGSRPGSTRSGARTDGCRGPSSSSRRCRLARDRRRDAAGARVVPRDARAGDDDARGRARSTRPAGRLLARATCCGSPVSSPALELDPRRGRDARSTPARSRPPCSSSIGERGRGRSPPTISRRTPPTGRSRSTVALRRAPGADARPASPASRRRSRRFDPAGGADALLAALERGDDDRRAHDEHHRRRRRRQRVRADDEPRPRLGRLATGARPASEQHARRDRPRPRAASRRVPGWRA